MQPTRMDLEMVSGADAEFEFVLMKNSGPINITNDTVEMVISDGYGKTWRVKKTSAPGTHFSGITGTVRFSVSRADIPPRPFTQIKWYEIWRIESGSVSLPTHPHIVGELKATGTVRT
jgi:hypothetical protein